ncbi:MAG: hypothetical protein NT090_11350, partial [Acidobacteria bacterium]|nr:hypothetical protein [Acidobacteriota bacterium]
ALSETFRSSRLLTATLGLAIAATVALSIAAIAASLLSANLLPQGTFVALLAAFVAYAGLLLTFGAVCRIVALERRDETLTPGAAFGFAFFGAGRAFAPAGFLATGFRDLGLAGDLRTGFAGFLAMVILTNRVSRGPERAGRDTRWGRWGKPQIISSAYRPRAPFVR